jgi:hypothetical protein
MSKSIIRRVKSIGHDQPILQTRRTDTQRLASLPTDAPLALQEAVPAAFDKQLDKLAIWLTPLKSFGTTAHVQTSPHLPECQPSLLRRITQKETVNLLDAANFDLNSILTGTAASLLRDNFDNINTEEK